MIPQILGVAIVAVLGAGWLWTWWHPFDDEDEE
jgi:hypothetical protein